MHRRRVLSLAAVMAILGTMLVSQAVPVQAGDLSAEGRFIAAFSENGDFNGSPPATVSESTRYPTAVSIAALPTAPGKYVFWNGLENLETAGYPLPLDAGRVFKNSRSRQLDLSALSSGGQPEYRVPSPESGGDGDMFCADQRILLDGSVIVSGGTAWANDPVDIAALTGGAVTEPGGTAELFGHNATRIFDPNASGGTWTTKDSLRMNYGRWYPAIVTLPDGKLFVAGGVGRLLYNSEATNVHQTETFDPYAGDGSYDPKNGSWTENGPAAEISLPLFARLHVIHDGKVFYGANGQMWGPFGQSYDQALWNFARFYDPATKRWSDVAANDIKDRSVTWGAVSGAAEVMLPFTPNPDGSYDTTRILQAGGVLGTSPGGYLATNLTRIVAINNGRVSSTPAGVLANRRWYSAAVLGGTGEVFVFNGADKDEVVHPNSEVAVRQVESYDPASNTWSALASGNRDRTYHNSAVLMADGRILVGGHSPINAGYGPGESGPYKANDLHANTGLVANNLKDPAFEIFEPPYLFRGPRPSFTTNVNGILEWGTTRNIAVSDADTIDKLMLVHMPSQTHVVDGDARAIELPVVARHTGSVEVKIPSERGVAVPGWYYLFAVRTNDGVDALGNATGVEGSVAFDKPTISTGLTVRVGNAAVFGETASPSIAVSTATLSAGTSVSRPIGLPGGGLAATPASPAVRTSSRRGLSSSATGALAAAMLVALTGGLLRSRRLRKQ